MTTYSFAYKQTDSLFSSNIKPATQPRDTPSETPDGGTTTRRFSHLKGADHIGWQTANPAAVGAV